MWAFLFDTSVCPQIYMISLSMCSSIELDFLNVEIYAHDGFNSFLKYDIRL